MKWNYILVEGYCARDWDCKKSKKPKGCKNKIGVRCIKCKYFAYAKVEDDFMEMFNKLVDTYET